MDIEVIRSTKSTSRFLFMKCNHSGSAPSSIFLIYEASINS